MKLRVFGVLKRFLGIKQKSQKVIGLQKPYVNPAFHPEISERTFEEILRGARGEKKMN